MATDCSYNPVQALAPATPERVEDIFVSMRAHLLRIITRWEQSGQGEGGQENEDAKEAADQDDAASLTTSIATTADGNSPDKTIGALSGRSARALQSRAAFLNGRPSYLLYFWAIADQHQLLQSSLQRLNNGTGASDASCAPSASSTSNRRGQRRAHDSFENHQQNEEQASLLPLVESIKELAECQRELVLDRREDRRHELEIEQQRRVSERCAQSSDRRFRRRAELSDLARKYRKLNAELDPNDRTSQRLSEFYLNEGREIEEEIRLLDRGSDNNS